MQHLLCCRLASGGRGSSQAPVSAPSLPTAWSCECGKWRLRLELGLSPSCSLWRALGQWFVLLAVYSDTRAVHAAQRLGRAAPAPSRVRAAHIAREGGDSRRNTAARHSGAQTARRMGRETARATPGSQDHPPDQGARDLQHVRSHLGSADPVCDCMGARSPGKVPRPSEFKALLPAAILLASAKLWSHVCSSVWNATTSEFVFADGLRQEAL